MLHRSSGQRKRNENESHDKEDEWSNNLELLKEDNIDEDDEYGEGVEEKLIKRKKVASVTNNKKKVYVQNTKSSTPACSKEGLVPLSRPKKKVKKEFLIDKEEEALPTYTRKTKKGGYAHTNLSKSRISKANSGNTPWNYGKRRSSADKAKIAAGVRAQNRTRLLIKLKLLGMTEEEWLKKKKEIKYLRERVRRAKKANQKLETELHSKKLQEALDATDETKNGLKIEETKHDDDEGRKKDEKEQKMKIEKEKNREQDERSKKIFPEKITFKPFSFSELEGMDKNYPLSCDEVCNGSGIGGLICCEDCSRKYNAYLNSTMECVETQRMNEEAEEVTEILDFLNEKKDILKRSSDSAKTKIPPLPPPGSRTIRSQEKIVRTPRTTTRPDYDNIDSEIDINVGASWNLTSAIDIGIIGNFASI